MLSSEMREWIERTDGNEDVEKHMRRREFFFVGFVI